VNISGKQYSATSGQNISVSLQNGTYSFAAYNVPGYTLNLTITTLTVNGHTLTITVNFVNNATVSSHVPPKSNSDLYIEIGAIVIVAVAAIAATLLIRKRKG
jgi:ribosomal protein L21